MDNELEKEANEFAKKNWDYTGGRSGIAFAAKFASTYSKREKEANRLLGIAAGLMQEVSDAHGNPLSPDYNQCEISACSWCEHAREALSQIHPQGENDDKSKIQS